MQLTAAAPVPPNPLKANLRKGVPQIGLWSALASNLVAEILGHAGFDWLVFDAEHGSNEIPSLIQQLQAIRGSTTVPIVRPPWNDPVQIKRLMDAGFHSLVIPFVQTAAEAQAAVAATRYPPDGVRGVAVSSRASQYGLVPDYLTAIGDQVCVIAQAESVAALNALPEICAVDGVDAVFIGPSDLSASMGLVGQIKHPAVQAEIKRGLDTCKTHGIAAGILCSTDDDTKRYLDMGFTFLGVGLDVVLLRTAARDLATRIKAL